MMRARTVHIDILVFLLIAPIFMALSTHSSLAQTQPGQEGMNTGPGSSKITQELTRTVAPGAGTPDAPLLFCIGVHIEPFGATMSPSAGSPVGFSPGRSGTPPSRSERWGFRDYHEKPFFSLHVRNLRKLEQVVERHRGRMTVQAQSPFTSVSLEHKETILADLAMR